MGGKIMKKRVKILALVLAIAVFAAFALGSNSKTEETGDSQASSSSAGGSSSSQSSAKEEYSVGEGVVKTYTDSIGTNYIEVSVPVENTGSTNLYLSSCSIDIENADGTLADTLQLVAAYPEIVKPGETAYYYTSTLFEGTVGEGYKAVPHVDVAKAKNDCIRLAVSEVQVKDQEYLGAKVIGRVENDSGEDQTLVYVVANLFDASGAFIGHEVSIVGEIKAGEKLGFETTGLNTRLAASDVASYEIYAFPVQYQF